VTAWYTLALSILTIAFSAFLLFIHWREWGSLSQLKASGCEGESREYDYRRRRLRRRTQSTALIGTVGLLMLGMVVLRWMNVGIVWTLVGWMLIVVLLLWICILAVSDMLATGRHFGRLRQDVLMEQARFLARLRQTVSEGRKQRESQSGNGKAPAPR
jgi:hypothetical protein